MPAFEDGKCLRAPGMRVLDIGSGMGAVALLNISDRKAASWESIATPRWDHARRRSVEQGCSSWVSFESANLGGKSEYENFAGGCPEFR